MVNKKFFSVLVEQRFENEPLPVITRYDFNDLTTANCFYQHFILYLKDEISRCVFVVSIMFDFEVLDSQVINNCSIEV